MTATRALLISSNGAGMGHLTRLAAISLRGADVLDSTLLSLSVALPVTEGLGLRGEYCPSAARGWMPQGHWHGYLRDRIVALARELETQALVFDGVAPYPGVGLARMRMPDVAFVWLRRGMWRAGVNTAQLKKAPFFDSIVEPGDIACAADRGATSSRSDAIHVPPITMVDAVAPLPRHEAAAALGLEPDRVTVLVTLGSGRLGEVAAPGRTVLEALMRTTDWQICVTRPDVALEDVPIRDRSRVVELRGIYPLVRYFEIFDCAVSAAGYNAVHELIPAAIPTLFVPNPATTTDDQVARADQLAREGLALSAHPSAEDELTHGVRTLADESRRQALATTCRALPAQRRSGGAAATAEHVATLGAGFEPAGPDVRAMLARAELWGRERLKGWLGPQRSDRVRALLGRPPIHGPGSKLRVAVESSDPQDLSSDAVPLLIEEVVEPHRIRAGGPVEHLLPGSSSGYHKQRMRIAAEYYDIVDG